MRCDELVTGLPALCHPGHAVTVTLLRGGPYRGRWQTVCGCGASNCAVMLSSALRLTHLQPATAGVA